MWAGTSYQEDQEPDVGPFLRNLHTLDMSQCRFKALPAEFGRLSSLTKLKCNGCPSPPQPMLANENLLACRPRCVSSLLQRAPVTPLLTV